MSRTEGIDSLRTLEGKQGALSPPLTCSEGMAGIQTHSHSALVPHFIDDAPQLREAAPHRTTLTAHVLQHWVQGGEATITLTHQSGQHHRAQARPGGGGGLHPFQGREFS